MTQTEYEVELRALYEKAKKNMCFEIALSILQLINKARLIDEHAEEVDEKDINEAGILIERALQEAAVYEFNNAIAEEMTEKLIKDLKGKL